MSSVVVAYDAVTKPDYVVAGAAADRAGEGSAIGKEVVTGAADEQVVAAVSGDVVAE
jgi:hypothetical protein